MDSSELQYYVEKNDYESDKRGIERRLDELESRTRDQEAQIQELDRVLRQTLMEVQTLRGVPANVEGGQVKYGRE